ncbi:aspartic proteinase 36 [Coffea arabica]|uniref:Aspartic proteinase 36 n=1 Tax=Coffea arabica TaxID=13443 RepID=A0A6P6UB54_COFAR|nr:aspartic proteinase-like protein 2 [Coffea arabica]XP_027087187.1 aspartic proteinase-like protein 2 [Coffea arabica]
MMAPDLRRNGSVVALALLVSLVVNGVIFDVEGNNNVVFEVEHKFKGRRNENGGRGSFLTSLKAHDSHRHGRMLAALDMPLGGNGSPTDAALYFTKLSIGTPPQDYYVQVDTGSDILWVNCAGCVRCPKKSSLGIDLTLYDMKASSTGRLVSCDQDFCLSAFNAPASDCKVGNPCAYSVTYGDGSSTGGYFVRDYAKLNQLTGNLQTIPMNGSIVFGCSSQQSGELGSSTEAVDGIIGFGQANSSIISQLASAGKVKKIFSHCLDGINGGGIFAIGQVVQPKLKTTPLVPNEAHYNVVLNAIEVGGDVLNLPSDVLGGGSGSGTIIDSGTTLAYLPDDVYTPLMEKITASQSNLKIHIVENQFKCFVYSGNVDDGFPVVTFHFEDSLSLTVYPHEYLFDLHDDQWCIGWQNKGMQTRDGREVTLLGDLVLANKLVSYDLENQTIGWAEYNCSSSIKLRDEKSGNVYAVGSHIISSARGLNAGKALRFLLLIITSLLHALLIP